MKILKFFNLLDRAGNLSLTNSAVVILLLRVAFSPTIDWSVVGALLIAFIGYSHKRVEERKASKDLGVEILDQKIQAISGRVDEFKRSYESVSKMADDTKKLLMQTNLVQAFNPRGK